MHIALKCLDTLGSRHAWTLDDCQMDARTVIFTTPLLAHCSTNETELLLQLSVLDQTVWAPCWKPHSIFKANAQNSIENALATAAPFQKADIEKAVQDIYRRCRKQVPQSDIKDLTDSFYYIFEWQPNAKLIPLSTCGGMKHL